MNNKSDGSEWFRNWFNHAYKFLYSHRHDNQALSQVKALESLGVISKKSVILDAACGTGRHMRGFTALGYKVFGFDLSTVLLIDAVGHGQSVAAADMRFPPFKPGRFDLVTSFFSSFGYFTTREDDLKALKTLLELIKPCGYMFLDLVSKKNLEDNLVPHDEKNIDGKKIIQRRKMSGDKVVKNITIENENGEIEEYSEHLRLYSKEEIEEICQSLSLKTVHIFGTETGGSFNEEMSPRMAMLLRKSGN